MSYRLNAITIHVNSAKEYKREMKEIWRDIKNGKLPILFDSEHNFQQGISPIYQYGNYSQNDFSLSVTGVASEFFKRLELKVIDGFYKKYDPLYYHVLYKAAAWSDPLPPGSEFPRNT